MSPLTTDTTMRPAGIERAQKGTGNPKGGGKARKQGQGGAYKICPLFCIFFFNILTLITYHRHIPIPLLQNTKNMPTRACSSPTFLVLNSKNTPKIVMCWLGLEATGQAN